MNKYLFVCSVTCLYHPPIGAPSTEQMKVESIAAPVLAMSQTAAEIDFKNRVLAEYPVETGWSHSFSIYRVEASMLLEATVYMLAGTVGLSLTTATDGISTGSPTPPLMTVTEPMTGMSVAGPVIDLATK